MSKILRYDLTAPDWKESMDSDGIIRKSRWVNASRVTPLSAGDKLGVPNLWASVEPLVDGSPETQEPTKLQLALVPTGVDTAVLDTALHVGRIELDGGFIFHVFWEPR